MATLTVVRPTLIELAQQSQNGDIIKVIEALVKKNDIFKDSQWIEANGGTYHKYLRRIYEPVGTFRVINGGTARERSLEREYTEGTCMLESRSEVDVKLVEKAANPKKFRFNKDIAHVNGLTSTFVTTFLYGNIATDPEQIQGLANRVGLKSLGTMVKGASGTGSDTTSIWIIQWGEEKCHFVYPTGGNPGGVSIRDLGELDALDANSNPFRVYGTLFGIDFGFVINDDRCIGRVANIESSGSSNIFDAKLVNAVLNQMPEEGDGAVIYVNSTLKTQIDNDAMNKTNVAYGSTEIYGSKVTTFRGHPIRQLENIVITETNIS